MANFTDLRTSLCNPNVLPYPVKDFAWATAPQTGDYGTLSLDQEQEILNGDNEHGDAIHAAFLDVFIRSTDYISVIKATETELTKLEDVGWQRSYIEFVDTLSLLRVEFTLTWAGGL